MQTLYDSDRFAVLHMEPDYQPTPPILCANGRPPAQALTRYGFALVDKRRAKEVYLDGEWAELFQREISAWYDKPSCEEQVQAILESYASLAQTPMFVH